MSDKSKRSEKVLIAAIIAVMIIECVALNKGFNGTILALSMTIIGGIVGWNIPQRKLRALKNKAVGEKIHEN